MTAFAAESSAAPTVLIEPPKRRLDLGLAQLWEYRQLLFFLTWRDVKVRYKQTLLGASWAILQPVAATIVFTIFLGRVAGLSSEGVPYALFSFVGLLPWTFFSSGVLNASNSLVNAASMITKIYFPRLALPISAVSGGAVDLACASLLLPPLMAYYGVVPTVRVLAFPLFLLVAAAAALGVGFSFAALNVRYRDVRYVVPLLVQLWLWATPVVYSASSIDQPWLTLYSLNPMVAAVEGVRWSILNLGPLPGWPTAVSCASALVVLSIGLVHFRRTEDSFADVI
jgi:lipopolysaccharide transport system permease protein